MDETTPSAGSASGSEFFADATLMTLLTEDDIQVLLGTIRDDEVVGVGGDVEGPQLHQLPQQLQQHQQELHQHHQQALHHPAPTSAPLPSPRRRWRLHRCPLT